MKHASILAPSILSADFGKLGEDIRAVEKAGAQYLHIDVMDGLFVPSISFGMPVIKSIRKETELFFDVHLMIVDPLRYIEDFAASGADGITFHLEAAKDPGAVIEKIRACGKKVGISVKPGTEFSEVIPFLDRVDMLLIMTVEPGFGGQKYIEAMTDKIRAAREYIDAHDLPVLIEVDGGIGTGTAQTAAQAGAEVLVAGSAVFGGDVCAKAKELIALL